MLMYDNVCIYSSQWNEIDGVVYIPCTGTVILSAITAHICCSNDD